jgi:tRNA A-37 threonylcarbamoyl transferase component Bud32
MVDPESLLARGRSADVFDRGDGTVLRRYRSDHDAAPEAALMSWLREEGYPVPAVHEASGTDIVMDLVPGPTMMEAIERRPWTMLVQASLLARLQARLNDITAPDWLETDALIPPGRSLLHLDFHPLNVILGPDGPVVIDWSNARRGAADFDAGYSYVMMSTYHVEGLADRLGQRAMLGAFSWRRGRGAVRRHLGEASRYRLTDANLTPAERAATARLAESSRRPNRR